MKILIIDDTETAASNLQITIEERVRDSHCRINTDFNNSIERIKSDPPDVVVLDIFRGSQSDGDAVGEEVFDSVWRAHFCPIIVYSANPTETLRERANAHPFVKCVTKLNAAADETVADHCESFRPHVNMVNEVLRKTREAIADSLKLVVPKIWSAAEGATERSALATRITNRRVAATLSAVDPMAQTLKEWEQYIFPPIAKHLRTGDVLQLHGSTRSSAESFRMVLTPTCDLARATIESPAQVLLAKCSDIESFVKACKLGDAKPKDLPKKLKSYLNTAYAPGVIALPALPGAIPHLAIELKHLELTTTAEIGLDSSLNKRLNRVASLDSPFRERVAWAYLQTAARPGAPDLDVANWANSIAETRTDNVS